MNTLLGLRQIRNGNVNEMNICVTYEVTLREASLRSLLNAHNCVIRIHRLLFFSNSVS